MIKKLFYLVFLFSSTIYSQQVQIKNYSTSDGLSTNDILSISQDEIGYLWLATKNGIVSFDGKEFQRITNKKSNTLFHTNYKTYVNLDSGLLIKNFSKEINSKAILTINLIENNIIVGTSQGIGILKKDFIQPLNIHPSLNVTSIYKIVKVDDTFYIASSKGFWIVNSLTNPKKVDKVSDGIFIDIEEFNNQLVLASTNGIFTYDIATTNINKVNTIKNITDITQYKNELWIATKTDGVEILALPSFSFKQLLNKYNYLQTNTINSIYKDKEDFIWLGTNAGLYQYKNLSFSKTESKPKVLFESISINNVKADSLIHQKEKFVLPYDANNISISFKTVSFSNTKNIQYRFAVNNDFNNWSTNNTIQLASLQPDTYKIRIQSKIGDQLSEGNFLEFTITKPFYKEFWFFLSIFIVFVLLIYILLNNHYKKIEKQNKEKIAKLKRERQIIALEQKALQLQMNPHFIFNVLNGIKSLGNSDKKLEFNKSVSQFSSLLRSILNNSRTEEITLEEEIQSLQNYLVLEQKMNTNSFDFEIKTDLQNIAEEEIYIPTMLIQPFVENAVKHAFNNIANPIIVISFKVDKQFLHCSITDNGIGFKQSQKKSNHKSAALAITKERLFNISKYSNFNIEEIKESESMKGTKVSFKLPLKTDF